MKRRIVITLLGTALAVVGIGIGSVIYFANGFATNNPFDRRNISSVLEENKIIKVDAEKPVILNVFDDSGSVTITGADVDTVQVKAVKTAYDSTKARADEEVKGVKYTIEQIGNTVTLKYELPKSMNFSNNVNSIDFIVTVPNETTVEVDTNNGEVSVSSTKGNVVVKNDFGDVTIEKIEGALSIDTNSGTLNATMITAGSENIDLNSDFGAITLKQANGKNITLDSNSGSITLSEVRATADLIVKSDFGSASFANGAANSLSIEANSGTISLVKLKITKIILVKDDFGDINLEQVFAASYDLHTNSGAITIEGAKGTLKASTDFGDIKIANAQLVLLDVKTNSGMVDFSGSLGKGPQQIKTDFGNIDLALPADTKLSVDLQTDFGDIKSDLPVTIVANQSSDSGKNRLAGSINGGGELLTVKTNSGSISIKILDK